MATSHQPTDIAAQFFIDGSYQETYSGVDLAGRIRGNDTIRISRGLSDQQSNLSASTASFTLNTRDGLFSDKNPASPLYGKFGRNVRAQLGVKTSGGTWDEYLRTVDVNSFATSQRCYTVDKASLDVTGDIDVRWEFTPAYTRNYRQTIVAKYLTAGNNRSWMVELRSDGQFALITSPDGTFTNALTNVSGVTMPATTGRIAYRVTLDVNDGAGNRVYRWYTATSITGTWTQISSGTVAGTTSIFSSTADLEVGSGNNSGSPFGDGRAIFGKIHAVEFYNGIGGTLVADFKPAGKGISTRTWADTCASPNTWLMTGSNIRLASDRVRWTGELASLPQDWDGTGRDRWVAVSGRTLAARYQSNKAPLASAIYRRYRNFSPLNYAYWPMEDSAGSTQAANAIPGGKAGQIVQCTFGSASGLDGSAGSLTLSNAPNLSKAFLKANVPLTATGFTTVLFYFNMATLPATEQVFATLPATSTTTRWEFKIGAATYHFVAYTKDNAILYDSGSIGFGGDAPPLDSWVGMQLSLSQESGNVRFTTAWHGVGSDTFYTHFGGGTTYAGTLGKGFLGINFDTPDAAFAGAQIAHVILSQRSSLDLVSTDFRDASKAWADEVAGRRMVRLADEENVMFEWLGDLDNSPPCGPQTPDTLANLFAAAAKVDGGLLGDGRDFHGYRYVMQNYLGNREQLTLNYGSSHLSDTPRTTLDDRYTVNDFTASRPSGSSARYEAADDRRLNTNDPDDPDFPGVGRYERSDSFNVATDDQLDSMAQTQVAIGTWDEFRIPNIAIKLHRTEIANDATLLANVIANDFGDPITLTGLAGKPLPPDDMRMLAIGYTETIKNMEWDSVSNTVPAGPYQVPVLGGDGINAEPRMDASGFYPTVLVGSLNTSATSLPIKTPYIVPAWCDSTNYAAEFPFDAAIGGEVVTVTAGTVPAVTTGTQGTFESGVSGWTPVSCTFTQSSTFAHTGTFSGLMTVTGSPTSADVVSASAVTITEGLSYTNIAWLRSAVTVSAMVWIKWRDASNALISTSSVTASLTSGAWTQRWCVDAAPANAEFAQFGVSLVSSPATGTLLYVDDITFTGDMFTTQTLTVTRSVNSVVKAHVDGEKLFLAEPAYFGMGVE